MSGVCVVSHNALSREGLSRIIESQGIGVSAAVGRVEDIDWSDEEMDQLVLLDCATAADQNHALDYVLGTAPGIRAIVLAESFELEPMTRCLRKGAQGYLVKDMPISSLVSSINLAATGEKVLPSELVELLCRESPFVSEPVTATEFEHDRVPLSQREFDVLNCIMAGYANKVIARQLEISEATIKVHVKAILRKLKVVNRTQAAIWAASRGLPGPVKHDGHGRAAGEVLAAIH